MRRRLTIAEARRRTPSNSGTDRYAVTKRSTAPVRNATSSSSLTRSSVSASPRLSATTATTAGHRTPNSTARLSHARHGPSRARPLPRVRPRQTQARARTKYLAANRWKRRPQIRTWKRQRAIDASVLRKRAHSDCERELVCIRIRPVLADIAAASRQTSAWSKRRKPVFAIACRDLTRMGPRNQVCSDAPLCEEPPQRRVHLHIALLMPARSNRRSGMPTQ